MKNRVSKQLEEDFKKLLEKKEAANQALLNALTYVKPFEEVKKLYQDLKSIETELSTMQTWLQLSTVELN